MWSLVRHKRPLNSQGTYKQNHNPAGVSCIKMEVLLQGRGRLFVLQTVIYLSSLGLTRSTTAFKALSALSDMMVSSSCAIFFYNLQTASAKKFDF